MLPNIKPLSDFHIGRTRESIETTLKWLQGLREQNVDLVVGCGADIFSFDIETSSLDPRVEPRFTLVLPSQVQVKFPRSKKKRIQKKWYKNPANWREVTL